MGVLNESLYFGFRGAEQDSHATILSVPIEAIFDGRRTKQRPYGLALGPGVGIRDMARHGNGFLLLTGAVGGKHLTPAIWYWRPNTAPRRLAILNTNKRAKAETLLVLPSDDPQTLRVLILFDGKTNGGPIEFAIPAP